jgi:hypothetical protein
MAQIDQFKAFRRLGRRRWKEVHLNRALTFVIIVIVVFFLVITFHQIHSAYLVEKAQDRILKLDELSKVATTLSAFFIAATFAITGQKYRQEASLNRKIEGNEFLVSIILGRLTDYRMKMNRKVDPYGSRTDGSQSYLESVKNQLLDPYGKDDILIKSFLNHLEYMCLAIHEGIIDEAIVKESQENMLFLYWKWFYPYIVDMRNRHYPEAWILIDYMVFRWRRSAAESVVREYDGNTNAVSLVGKENPCGV